MKIKELISIYILSLFAVLSMQTVVIRTAVAAENSVPSEGCSYGMGWDDGRPAPAEVSDDPTVTLKTTYKVNLGFDGCNSFSTRLVGTSPTGNKFIDTCFDITATNRTFSASVYFDTPGLYVIKASVFYASTDCSRNNQNKDVQITAWAQAATVVISNEQATVTDKSATITWSTSEKAEATVWLRLKDDPSKGSKPPATTSGKMVFNNLSPSTDYIYTVYATTDGWKTNATGADHYFKTNAPGVTAPTNSSTIAPNNSAPKPALNIPDSVAVSNVPDYDHSDLSLEPLIHADSVPAFLASLVKFMLLLIAGLSVIVILIGAFRMAMSQGKSEALTAGKKTITWAIIGLVVALLSYSIVAILQSVLGV
jgi:hypothetical protein